MLILGGALEYQRVSNLLSSFDTLLQQVNHVNFYCSNRGSVILCFCIFINVVNFSHWVIRKLLRCIFSTHLMCELTHCLLFLNIRLCCRTFSWNSSIIVCPSRHWYLPFLLLYIQFQRRYPWQKCCSGTTSASWKKGLYYYSQVWCITYFRLHWGRYWSICYSPNNRPMDW